MRRTSSLKSHASGLLFWAIRQSLLRGSRHIGSERCKERAAQVHGPMRLDAFVALQPGGDQPPACRPVSASTSIVQLPSSVASPFRRSYGSAKQKKPPGCLIPDVLLFSGIAARRRSGGELSPVIVVCFYRGRDSISHKTFLRESRKEKVQLEKSAFRG